MALTIVSVWPLLEPWRGSDDQISIVALASAAAATAAARC